MAMQRFAKYQYETSPRKLEPEYDPYPKKRVQKKPSTAYTKKEENKNIHGQFIVSKRGVQRICRCPNRKGLHREKSSLSGYKTVAPESSEASRRRMSVGVPQITLWIQSTRAPAQQTQALHCSSAFPSYWPGQGPTSHLHP